VFVSVIYNKTNAGACWSLAY